MNTPTVPVDVLAVGSSVRALADGDLSHTVEGERYYQKGDIDTVLSINGMGVWVQWRNNPPRVQNGRWMSSRLELAPCKHRGIVMHASKVTVRKTSTKYSTLCGRMNAKSQDGMNIAFDESGVTCKFCLRALARIGQPS